MEGNPLQNNPTETNNHPTFIVGEQLLSELENANEELAAKPGFKKRAGKFLKYAAYTFLSYGVLSTSLEVGKRVSAEKDYEKAKIAADAFAKENDPTVYRKSYEKAKDLFGEDNIFFAQTPTELKNHISGALDEKKSLERIHKHQYDPKEIALMSILGPIVMPKNIFINGYQNEYKDSKEYTERVENSSVFYDLNDQYTKKKENWKNLSNLIDTATAKTKSPEKNASVVWIRNQETKEGDTLEVEIISEIAQETLPVGWYKDEVSKIIMTETTKAASVAQHGESATGSQEAAHFEPLTEKVVLRTPYMGDPVTTFQTVNHEIGHANDWESSNTLNAKQRLELLLNIYDRTQAKNRFMSKYVESINPTNIQNERYCKAVEYWAEICGEYFTNGPDNLSQNDITLIEDVIKLKDKNFNIENSIIKRNEILQVKMYKKSPESAAEGAKVLYELFEINKKYNAAGFAFSNFYMQNEVEFRKLAHAYNDKDPLAYFDKLYDGENPTPGNKLSEEYIRLLSQSKLLDESVTALYKKYRSIPGNENVKDYYVGLYKY